MFHYTNSSEFDKLLNLMKDICAPDFQTHVKGHNPLFDFVMDHDPFVHKTATVIGVESFVNMSATMANCVPDRLYTVKDTIIRNRPDSMVIMCKFVISGTLVLKMKIDDSNISKQKEPIVADFHQGKITSSCIVGNEDSPTVSAECMATLQLNKDGKICRMIIDYTRDRNKNWVKLSKRKRKSDFKK